MRGKSIILKVVFSITLPSYSQVFSESSPAKNWQKTQTFLLLDPTFQSIRAIHDSDGDGYCDLWASLRSVKKLPNNPNQDSDGDGL
jgi:hypothetical protein